MGVFYSVEVFLLVQCGQYKLTPCRSIHIRSMSQKSHLHAGSQAQDLVPQVVYAIQS